MSPVAFSCLPKQLSTRPPPGPLLLVFPCPSLFLVFSRHLLIPLSLLFFVPQARAAASLPPLVFSESLSLPADDHCLEMANNKFTSHYNLAGQKPYQRYSSFGHTEHVTEKLYGVDCAELDVMEVRGG